MININRSIRVAIVEDEEPWKSQYAKWIASRRPHWNTVNFEDSQNGTILELLRGKFDLVLLDIKLSHTDPTGGFRILRRLLEHFGERSPAVLVLTGTPHPRDIEIMRALSVDEVTTKPRDADGLFQLIDYVMTQRARAPVARGGLKLIPYAAFRNCCRGDDEPAASLTAVESAVLYSLVCASPEPVRSDILEKQLPTGGHNALQKVIGQIRGKLVALFSAEELAVKEIDGRLVTLPGVGYAWLG